MQLFTKLIIAVVILLCNDVLTQATAFEVSFSQSTYYGEVFTLEDTVGKILFKAELLYNSIITSFITKQYSLYRTDSLYFAIDNNGTVSLHKNLPSRRLYSFQISLLYTVALKTGDTRSGFLTVDCRVQGIGPVYFDNSAYRVEVTSALEQCDHIYDFNKHILYNTTSFSRVYYKFDDITSSYFAIGASTGVLYARRTLVPGTFTIRIEIEYDVTFRNGSVFSSTDEYVYATVVVIGCRELEESTAMWSNTYPCSQYTASCNSLDSYFTSGTMTRICSSDGNWLTPDFTQCVVQEGVGPFALVWMTFSTLNGSYVLGQLNRIKRDVEAIFPRGSVNNITIVAGYQSNVQYGFMVGFRMVVNPSLLSEANIRTALVRLKISFRFGGIYFRAGSTGRAGRGIRVFNEARAQCSAQTLMVNDTSYVQVCGGSSCNCNSNTIGNGSCTSIEIRDSDVLVVTDNAKECSCHLPNITTHPSNHVITLSTDNHNLLLTCEADGATSYNWERQSSSIPSGAIGVDTNTLTIINLQPEYAGNYRCVATNDCGNSSSNATITINVQFPVLTTLPSSQSVDFTQTATFTCSATGYNVSYKWTIGSGSFPSKVTGINTNTLVIPDVRSSDDNTYTCVASNEGGSVSSNGAKLTVTGLPEVTVIPSSQSVDVTDTATFYAVARGVGSDMFTYQWRNGRRNIRGANGPILTISNVKRGDTGSYRCVIENKDGDIVVSDHVRLSIANCRPLNDPHNGKVFAFPDCNSAVYTCNPGYTISGTALVECISGRWSSPPVTCTTLP
ncbi:uncharacterized protein [Dysidea avara]|uniref:uncharacterized protein isoform X2 n=1 Tax=Dysidea avara TaxID=196820 RepID=UPI0033317B43